ncbi:MAG: hypothetical protein ACKPKO_32340, partial [Candidatus Fonsibacter sp.]
SISRVTITPPTGAINCSIKRNLLEECKCRGMNAEELWRLPNKQIASMLIAHDKTKVVIHNQLMI